MKIKLWDESDRSNPAAPSGDSDRYLRLVPHGYSGNPQLVVVDGSGRSVSGGVLMYVTNEGVFELVRGVNPMTTGLPVTTTNAHTVRVRTL